ncbi:alkylphosphonate utilization protein [Flavobacterium sp. 3HN19-14]|uniref:alkylphosphonate utilization protein n=1 Tax=Flavobacterium sp. 3HN19-14 TaxID=3448133 RepID=UPI003EE2365D
MEVKDSNGNILSDGDSVTVIKDLKVRGSSDVIKRGTMVKNIRLTDDPAEIDCRVNKNSDGAPNGICKESLIKVIGGQCSVISQRKSRKFHKCATFDFFNFSLF